MKKHIMDLTVSRNDRLTPVYSRIVLTTADGSALPDMLPGQFVQIRVDGSQSTFLRRPISINFVDRTTNELHLLVRKAGAGTTRLTEARQGDIINIMLPLGNSFSRPSDKSERLLLIGGGVGVAPLLYLGHQLKAEGFEPEFLLGARSKADLLELEQFNEIGSVHIATDDGSAGQHGLVTAHSRLNSPVDRIYCCGPSPMMKAVASVSRRIGAQCEVSLENMMACGLGACLCCVEQTVRGNVCVCTEGPVFNINELTWHD
ncbi:MAG: dihydroorotate dehydrogenase electron transfer subunit [Muribaculaceae bacterium]|nr:dihydroorotate dehydrogenase electron transfer subunit [Muribaculaceae bacterium]